jgi:hypothetical protein
MIVMTRLVTAGSDGSGGMHGQRGVEIIDLEKDRVAIGFERAKVMFFVWIVGVAKVVVNFDGLDDVRDCFGSERSMPVVMTACPWPKFFRSASLRVLMRSI